MTASLIFQLLYGFCSMAVRYFMRKKSLWAPAIDFFGQGLWIAVIVLDGMYGTILVTGVNLVFAVLVFLKWRKDEHTRQRSTTSASGPCVFRGYSADERELVESVWRDTRCNESGIGR